MGSFPANRQGLFDLSGNVWQWCEDAYDGISGKRTVRGATYISTNYENLMLSWRNSFDPGVRTQYVGFRVVLDTEGVRTAR